MGKVPTPPELKGIFEEAAAIASAVPESMHGVAFSRAVDELMRSAGFGADTESEPDEQVRRVRTPAREGAKKTEGGDRKNVLTSLLDEMDSTKHPEARASTSALDRSLHVLRAARDDHEVDGLTPPEISRILIEKFRVSTSRQAVSMALAGAGDYVNRRMEGGSYLYRLMQPGDEYLDAPKDRKEPSEKSSPRRRKSSRKKTAVKNNSAEQQDKSSTGGRRRTSGRPSPKQLLEGLLMAGFFDSPQTIGSVIDHVKARRGHTYKPTDLSPAFLRLLREGQLMREKNESNQYEYTRVS